MLKKILASRLFTRLVGIGLIIIGFIGLFVPVIQGFLFMSMGVSLLDNHKIDRTLAWFKDALVGVFKSVKKKF